MPLFKYSWAFPCLLSRRLSSYDYFEQCDEAYDYYHAQDCISANALAILRDFSQKMRHPIPYFIRTIHHIDDYNHPYLQQCQDRSIRLPDLCLCVSQYWQEQIWQHYQVHAKRVINGVDILRFSRSLSGLESHLQQCLHLNGSPIYLTVGGIEPRKNSIALLAAFSQVLKTYPSAQLIIAGGDTFLTILLTESSFLIRLSKQKFLRNLSFYPASFPMLTCPLYIIVPMPLFSLQLKKAGD